MTPSPIHPEVRAQFPSFTTKFEGRVSTMYADVSGLITVGLGCLIDPGPIALALPFRRSDGSLANASEIAAEWIRLKAMSLGHLHFRVQAARASLTLSLSEDAIDELARVRLDAAAIELVKHFPLFASWPAEVQLAVLSMAWAMGAAFAPKWPKFTEAALRGDWAACAENCRMRETGNPGVVPRNRANAALFLAAAERAPEAASAPVEAIDRARLEYLITVWLDEQLQDIQHTVRE